MRTKLEDREVKEKLPVRYAHGFGLLKMLTSYSLVVDDVEQAAGSGGGGEAAGTLYTPFWAKKMLTSFL